MKILFAVLVSIAFTIAPAMAQFAPAPTGTTIDLAPIVNPMMQVLGVIIMGLCVPLAWAFVGKMLKSWGIEATVEMNATRAVIDGIAQKAIGGAIAKYAVKPGEISIDTKSTIIADAANALVVNAGESLTKLGVKDNEKIAKAREMIESRLGLMDAAAAGTPVPNPSQPVAVMSAQPAPVTPPAA